MHVQIPSDFDPVVQKLISDGRFANETEVVAEGIKLVLQREQLAKDVRAGIDDLDAGNRVAAENVYAKAREQIKAIENEQAL